LREIGRRVTGLVPGCLLLRIFQRRLNASIQAKRQSGSGSTLIFF
jgi:hypothetical protein